MYSSKWSLFLSIFDKQIERIILVDKSLFIIRASAKDLSHWKYLFIQYATILQCFTDKEKIWCDYNTSP